MILKGILPYPELREKINDDFLELFPDIVVYDPPEDLFEHEDWTKKICLNMKFEMVLLLTRSLLLTPQETTLSREKLALGPGQG